MRVRSWKLGALLLSVMLAAGCSGSDTDSSEESESSGAFPVTIEHAYGSTTVSAKPERIVTLGVTDADVVLALGQVPVGNTGFAFYETGLGPWTEEQVGDADLTLIESDSEPNFEQIAGLAPDLILGVTAGFDVATYTKLSEIAPTIARPAGTAAYAVPRAQVTETIATALGVPGEGDELNTKTDQLIADTVAKYPQFADKTGVAILSYSGVFAGFLPGDGRGQFLTSLGFQIPEEITSRDTGDTFYVEVSAENVNLLDADVMLVLGPDENFDIVALNPAFANTTAGRNGAIIAASLDQRGAITYNSVLSIPYALDNLAPRIADALN
ncbi:iron-siderophore ABC transporter substrate-binding protein [Rhodococcoides yunnanense]|uniref:iron-siderophore ABC transporter substrate-binding protein n=1 Tax=Rhodococcoides yunnanense TaxID=278209 RepID=UPI000A57034E|nr:iron-siderophore ABC transporter substrate-binding protein [Rhodococcus yunnanensis]